MSRKVPPPSPQGLILSSHIHDPLMKTQVIGQLGMEGGGEDVPLPHGNGEPVDPGEYLHAGADLFNERRSDEHGFEEADPLDCRSLWGTGTAPAES